MALTINDRVKETSSTTGTGALTFSGAVSGFETFSAGIGNSNTTYYAVVNTDTPTEWEVGLGTLAGDSSTIARTTVISSSNSDSAVNFGSGTKEIFCTLPASKAVIKDASGNVTPSGVITGTTVEATGDTAASDNAAMGYTSAEGLILTGQGSTSDVTIKNDADADVVTIATGTTNVDVVGDVTASTLNADGDTAASDNAAIGYTSAEGLILTGQGSTNDVTIKNDADADVITIATGATNVDVVGDLTAGTLNADGDTAAGDNAAIGYTAAEGLILTGQGSTNDITIKNDADAAVISIPTGATGVTFAGTVGSGAITSTGVVTGTGFTIGSAVINEAELETIDGVTAGTVAASKAVVVDANKDIGTFRNITIDGTFSDGNYTFDTSGNVSGLGTIGSGAITSTGVIIGTTIEPNADTSSGDNAAIGYTSAEGLILTGQGSTSDVTLKNDADGTVFTVPTGTDDILFPDSAKAMLGAGSDMTLYHDGSNSYITNSQGALKIATESSGIAITLGHGTSEVTVADNLTVTGTLTGTLATAAQGSVTSLGTLTALTVDSVSINGATIGHTSDTDLMTVADGVLTVAGELDATTLDISGNADIDGTLETDALSINGTTVTSTAAELNILDGVTSTAAEINLLDGLDRGSILYGNSSSATTVLGQGSADTVLTSDGTDISWAAVSAGGVAKIEAFNNSSATSAPDTTSVITASTTVTAPASGSGTVIIIGKADVQGGSKSGITFNNGLRGTAVLEANVDQYVIAATAEWSANNTFNFTATSTYNNNPGHNNNFYGIATFLK